MTQKAACLLALLLSGLVRTGASQDVTPPTTAPLVVAFLDPHHPQNAGRLKEGRPPLVFEGKQAESIEQLRYWLFRSEMRHSTRRPSLRSFRFALERSQRVVTPELPEGFFDCCLL